MLVSGINSVTLSSIEKFITQVLVHYQSGLCWIIGFLLKLACEWVSIKWQNPDGGSAIVVSQGYFAILCHFPVLIWLLRQVIE